MIEQPTIIPAQPGTRLLSCSKAGYLGIFAEVLAFEYWPERHRFINLFAVTVRGRFLMTNGEGTKAIEFPAGHIETDNGQRFASSLLWSRSRDAL